MLTVYLYRVCSCMIFLPHGYGSAVSNLNSLYVYQEIFIHSELIDQSDVNLQVYGPTNAFYS